MIIIKNKSQIEGIRKSCILAKETLNFIEPFVKIGITTNELNQLIHEFIIKNNAIPAPLNYKGFPKSICTSVNSVVCHGIPDDYDLKDGDIINIDVATILEGFYGDTCRMFEVGNVSEKAKKLINVTKECMELGINVCGPNVPFGEIGKAISKHANKHGFAVVSYFCGHGTGIHFHESPNIMFDGAQYDKNIMKKGMIFTIEPMINEFTQNITILEDNWTAITEGLSAQFEHTILITDNGTEILT